MRVSNGRNRRRCEFDAARSDVRHLVSKKFWYRCVAYIQSYLFKGNLFCHFHTLTMLINNKSKVGGSKWCHFWSTEYFSNIFSTCSCSSTRQIEWKNNFQLSPTRKCFKAEIRFCTFYPESGRQNFFWENRKRRKSYLTGTDCHTKFHRF